MTQAERDTAARVTLRDQHARAADSLNLLLGQLGEELGLHDDLKRGTSACGRGACEAGGGRVGQVERELAHRLLGQVALAQHLELPLDKTSGERR